MHYWYLSDGSAYLSYWVKYVNQPPVAYIDSITPNPAVQGEKVSFAGHGTDEDGSVVAYEWRSSINGILSTQASFGTSNLSAGNHTIYFKVQDDGSWSSEASAILQVLANKPQVAVARD